MYISEEYGTQRNTIFSTVSLSLSLSSSSFFLFLFARLLKMATAERTCVLQLAVGGEAPGARIGSASSWATGSTTSSSASLWWNAARGSGSS
jgi:hypothetical protein